MTYKVGRSDAHPWGVETVIHILDDKGVTVRSVTVMQWPEKDEKLQAERGAKLIQNYLDNLAEAEKPSPTLDRATVEKLLVEKGLLKEGTPVEQIASKAELVADEAVAEKG